MLEQQKTESELDGEPPHLVFHENCGTNIRLTKCNTTAKRIEPQNSYDGLVVSRDAMATNLLYKVRMDAILGKDSRLFFCVTSIPPTLLVLTKDFQELEKSVIVKSQLVCQKEKVVLNTLGEGLQSLQIGSRYGLLVDSSNDLHLYVDGQDKGVAEKHVERPSFAVFDIYKSVIKVTAQHKEHQKTRRLKQ